jgi:uncharacterized protein involved in tolerance to divalent cations
LPQNVVLYQYQACPFCNKVRGETPSSVCYVWNQFSTYFWDQEIFFSLEYMIFLKKNGRSTSSSYII